ncbi:cupin-like domain-containing protein [Mucilaginibacter psychrotolerans]|uniref:Cupin-like domain-containing protein n=1 Tax=Mucilaginibacter psychrotolerans TaxID=1524096 RepID=A0A4Y8SQ27_9SPHI|nr:cupin-like domain-containing protein [Mucilaginibacter psychrotolerans]TFF40740.1 cupin-like domain-containing protein [Mucilaginibacter psychrotolerans]
MSFKLSPIDTVDTISPEDFREKYLTPRRPLVIKGLTKNWPAREKWTPEYLKEVVGNKVVPLYDNSKADPSKPINSSAKEMPFNEYIDLIRSTPTELRIFFFNIFKQAPQLLDDIVLPKDLMGGFLESMPAMFFGGSNSVTFLHYDIDLPHIFHTHFGGRKHVILFENKWKRRLYCIPNATYALEDYDVQNPDVKKFPALNGVEGIEVFLEHGDTLFMPTGYWHWMKYIDGSYSLSLRAWDASITRKAASLYNLAIKGGVDSLLKMAFKGKYAKYREALAIKWAEKELAEGKPL